MNRQSQQPEKKARFYQTKGFRGLIAVVLAVILLGNGAIDRVSSLFATDEAAPEAFNEVTVPDFQPVPEPKPEPKPQPEPESKPEPTPEPESKPEPTPEPALQPAVEEGLGDRDQGVEEADDPTPEPALLAEGESESEDDPIEEAAPGEKNPLAQAIAAEGLAYVRVSGDVFSSANLREKDLLGRVTGIAIATQYNEASDNTPATIRVVFATESALEEGFMDAASAMLQGYEDTINEIGEGVAGEYRSAAWPLPLAGFDPKEPAKPAIEEPVSDEVEPVLPVEPVITLSASIENGEVTLTAQIEGIPEGVAYVLQWQNDRSGEFEDVPGETGISVTFDNTPENVSCMWRVALQIMDADEGNAGDQ